MYGTRQRGRPSRCKSLDSPQPARPTPSPSVRAFPPVTETSSGLPDQRERAWPSVQKMRAVEEGFITSHLATWCTTRICWPVGRSIRMEVRGKSPVRDPSLAGSGPRV